MKWIKALNPVLKTNEGTSILADAALDTIEGVNLYSTKFWIDHWYIYYADFSTSYDENEFYYATDAFKYITEYAVGVSEADMIVSAIDDSLSSVTDFE